MEILILLLSLSILFYILREVLKADIKESIRLQYDQQLEDYRFARLKRQKAELISELFSKWIKYYGREYKLLSNDQLIERHEELNRLSFELALWMEDDAILTDIMTRLANREGAKEVRELVVDVRKILLEKEDTFDPNKIVLWPHPNDLDKYYGPLS